MIHFDGAWVWAFVVRGGGGGGGMGGCGWVCVGGGVGVGGGGLRFSGMLCRCSWIVGAAALQFGISEPLEGVWGLKVEDNVYIYMYIYIYIYICGQDINYLGPSPGGKQKTKCYLNTFRMQKE